MTSTWIIQATVALKNNQIIDGCVLKDGTLQTYGDVSYLNQLPKVNELFRHFGLTNGVVTELPSNVLDYTYRFNYIGTNGHIDIVGESNNLESPITDCIDSCDLIDDVDLVSTINELYPSYVLTVVGGTGSGIYSAGAIISIVSPPLENQLFSKWIIDSGDPVIGDITSDNTTLTMPASDVTIHRETPVEQTLGLANLRSLALDCSYMLRPGYPGLESGKEYYLAENGQWTNAHVTIATSAKNVLNKTTLALTSVDANTIGPSGVIEPRTVKLNDNEYNFTVPEGVTLTNLNPGLRMIEDTNTSGHSIGETIAIPAGRRVAVSFEFKNVSGTRELRVFCYKDGVGACGVKINLGTSAVTALPQEGDNEAPADIVVIDVANGFKQVTFTGIVSASLAAGQIYCSFVNGSGTYEGDGTSGCDIRYLQVELAAEPTSWINGAAATVRSDSLYFRGIDYSAIRSYVRIGRNRTDVIKTLEQRSDLVNVCGYLAITTTANFGGANPERHLINTNYHERIRQNCSITQATLRICATTNMNNFYLEFWRKNGGGTYDRVGITEDLRPQISSAPATVTFTFAAVAVQQGDYVGIKIVGPDQNGQFAVDSPGAGIEGYLKTGIIGTSAVDIENTWSGWNYVLPIRLSAPAPVIVAIGDSNIAQADGFWSDSAPYDDYSMLTSLAALNTHFYARQNMGISGDNCTGIEARFAADCVALHPRFAFISIGTNDIAEAITEATYIAKWTSMLNACVADGIIPVVGKILPSGLSNAAMTKRDQWMAALVTLLRTSYPSARFVDADVALGQNRVGGVAGNLWDIKTEYAADGVHLNEAGYAVWAQTILDQMYTGFWWDENFAHFAFDRALTDAEATAIATLRTTLMVGL